MKKKLFNEIITVVLNFSMHLIGLELLQQVHFH